jgi:hypothetical protein
MKKKIKESKFENSSWNFELDQTSFYAFWNNAFSKEECQTIINIAKNKGLIKGKTRAESDVRDSTTYLGYMQLMIWIGYFAELLTSH